MHKHHDGFIYRLDTRIAGGAESWRIHINNEGAMREVSEHNHVVNPGVVEAKLSVTQIKQRAENSRDAPRLLIQQAQATLSDEALAEVPQYNSMQRTTRGNAKSMASQLLIRGQSRKLTSQQTLRGDDFLLHDPGKDDPGRFFIFGTQRNLDMLANNRHWFADGTFKVAPHLFYQMHTIHAIHEHSVLPMVYVLMQSKRAEDYARVLTTIQQLKENLHTESIMCDFELGFHNAFRRIFGDDVIVRCLFHLGQCVHRKVQELGLSELYLQEEEVHVRCKMLVALAFVPIQDVVAAFESLVEDIPAELISLIDYFEDTWIGRLDRRDQRRNPLFPIRLWSIYDRVVQGLPTTNNSVEAWHLAFQ